MDLAEGPGAGCCAAGLDAGSHRCLDLGGVSPDAGGCCRLDPARDGERPEAVVPGRRVSLESGSSPSVSQGCRCAGKESPPFLPGAGLSERRRDWQELRPWRPWPLRVLYELCSGSRETSEHAWVLLPPSQLVRLLGSCLPLLVVLGNEGQQACPLLRRVLLLCLRRDVEESESARARGMESSSAMGRASRWVNRALAAAPSA